MLTARAKLAIGTNTHTTTGRTDRRERTHNRPHRVPAV